MYNLLMTYSGFILNESLKTHDIDISIKNINRELSLMGNISFSITKNSNNTFNVILHNFNFNQILPSLFDYLDSLIINRHGWFPSSMDIKYLSGMQNNIPYDEEFLIKNSNFIFSVEILYEAKQDLIVDNIPNVLYHLSIQEYETSILKKGLEPKSKSKLSKHLDRIYLCPEINNCYNLISKMKWFYISKVKDKNKINYKWIIYEINIQGLSLKLYKDPNSSGYYVIDNIPPSNIKIIDKEKQIE